MTSDEAYALGKKIGRERALEEISKLLGLDELIAKAIALHEQQYHDGRPQLAHLAAEDGRENWRPRSKV